MKKNALFVLIFLCALLSLCLIWAVSSAKMHDFEGKCSICHENIPQENTAGQNLIFKDDIDSLCANCHTLNSAMSHPIRVRPNIDSPLTAHLDKNGQMTCTTCHDVHKEDKTSNAAELSGLLWGHVRGRAFCSLCHNTEDDKINWQHQTAIPFAHSSGKLTQGSGGALLDKYSAECLSCHDGTISKAPHVEVKEGLWQHAIGLSHPVGVDYPSSEEFQDAGSLPKEVRLFDGRVGCLSCHEIYVKRRGLLTMDNSKSRLCFGCHKK